MTAPKLVDDDPAPQVVAYVRVSTNEQADNGLGLEVQAEACESWARTAGVELAAVFSDEGISGSNGLEARLGLADALVAATSRPGGTLVVYRLDRLARDVVLQEQLLAEVWKAGGRVVSCSPAEDAYLDPDGAELDPSRELIRVVLGAVAQWERKMARLRMRSGAVRKRAAGGYGGGRPGFGVSADGRGGLEFNEDEMVTVWRILELRDEGLSLREVAATLDSEGRRSRNGGPWQVSSLGEIERRWREVLFPRCRPWAEGDRSRLGPRVCARHAAEVGVGEVCVGCEKEMGS